MPISFSGEATFIAEQKDSANMYHRRLLFSYSRRSGEGTERCLLTTLITTKSYWKYRSFLKKGVTVRLHGEERNVIVKGTIRSIHFIIFIFVWNDELKKYTLIPEDLEQKRA